MALQCTFEVLGKDAYLHYHLLDIIQHSQCASVNCYSLQSLVNTQI